MEEKNNLKVGLVLSGVMALALGIYWAFYYEGLSESANDVKGEKVFFMEWNEIASSTPFLSRDSHASFVFQDRIWIIGGLNGNGLVSPTHQIKYWQAPHLNYIWVSENGRDWKEIETENIWAPRRSMSIIEFKNKLWMLGGWSTGGGYSNELWNSEDGVDWTKTEIKFPFEPREGQIAGIFNEKLFIMGGVNYDRRKTFNDVW